MCVLLRFNARERLNDGHAASPRLAFFFFFKGCAKAQSCAKTVQEGQKEGDEFVLLGVSGTEDSPFETTEHLNYLFYWNEASSFGQNVGPFYLRYSDTSRIRSQQKPNNAHQRCCSKK